MSTNLISPNALFEVSWEVCNKVGGIHTVVSTKAFSLIQNLKDNLILIGPDVYRDGTKNPEFIEDKDLYSIWATKAKEEGLVVRIGRWNISGKPVVIIVDFTLFFSQKDKILAKFWEDYKLDSIAGQWDYIEPILFGYAAAKVIESFSNYHYSINDKIVAQFHEWMTGSGILYLEDAYPQIATAFTTHATIMGRSLAGNGKPLYQDLKTFNPDIVAKDFNIVAKNSMETLAALHADVFTTVSEITSNECAQFLKKKVDFVTPNGFEDNFVPKGEEFDNKRTNAQKTLTKISEAVLGYKLAKDTLFIATSGRYEYKNKGLDLYIDALKKLNNDGSLEKEIVAFIMVPASNYGPQKEVLSRLNGDQNTDVSNPYLTHGLHYIEHDPVMNAIYAANLNNTNQDKVKIIFVPAYLNGDDGIFNIPYYDLLIGLDLTVFVSYYEPWGYTPLESIAFYVPTVTTSLAGFGMWMKNSLKKNKLNAVTVIERTDNNDEHVVSNLIQAISEFSSLSNKDNNILREQAFELSKMALWKNLTINYKTAYSFALEKVELRRDKFYIAEPVQQEVNIIKTLISNEPIWKSIKVESCLPERFSGLKEIAFNLWWSWNDDAIELFNYICKDTCEQYENNPVRLINKVSLKRLNELAENPAFLKRYDAIYKSFKDYMKEKPDKDPLIAYFSMEYGFDSILKIYSGGLGILAGDYLKEASDQKVNIIGIGLLYRDGYFKQEFSLHGEQMAISEPQEFTNLPILPVLDKDGNWKKISIIFPGRSIHARIWQVNVGRIKLYLLDTDFIDNQSEDRGITNQLYGGNWENRLKQELLLGIGGIRLLDELKYKPNIYHCNEGHAAFIFFERMRKLIQKRNYTFSESIEILRASSLFTTHTPVPAGHDAFSEDMMRTYLSHYPGRFGISWEEFMGLGRSNPNNLNETFSMSYLAAKLSQEINGVSKLHGEVTRKMFNNLWPAYMPDELHIGYVTNGVHFSTWTASEWKKLYKKYFGTDYLDKLSDKSYWNKIYDVPDNIIWNTRNDQRKILVDFVKNRLEQNWIRRRENPKTLWEIKNTFDEKTLTIGFARRFATYKRAHLLFSDLERLSEIVNNEDQPVQFIFAGKAHPNDKPGQDLIKDIVKISRKPEFIGKILFLENYDIALAKKLVQGVDIWMNTPTRPLEASGTSGMKAIMNGVLNFSVLDGWWLEGYCEGAGWAITEKKSYENQAFQDELDSETIYSMLEHEIIPLYYDRNKEGVPVKWINFIKNSIANIAPEFTTKRMIDDYISRFYNNLYNRAIKIKSSEYELAEKMSKWKQIILSNWDKIEVLEKTLPDTSQESLKLGDKIKSKLVLNLGNIYIDDIGVELIITEYKEDNDYKIVSVSEYKIKKHEGSVVTYETISTNPQPGIYNYGVRIYPKNKELPHRQDFAIVKWL